MSTLLAIEVSPRHEFSTSRKLTAHFIDQWKAAHPGSAVVVRDLTKTPPPFVDLAWIGGAFTPREQHSPESVAAIRVSDDLVAELKAADHIVIGTPMFNFSIPAVLKAYIDQIVRVGVTVSPNNVGLLTGKKATVILASGGDFSPGSPVEKYNQASGYLRQVLAWIGIKDVDIILAGRARAGGTGETAVEQFGTAVRSAAAATPADRGVTARRRRRRVTARRRASRASWYSPAFRPDLCETCTMTFTLYNAPQSTCSQRVRFVLNAKNIPFGEIKLDLLAGDQLKPDYLALNPNGVVPTLDHDGAIVIDSSVIIEYLDEIAPEPATFTPENPVLRAKMRALMHFIDEMPAPAVRVPTFNLAFLPRFAAMSEDAFKAFAEFEAAAARIHAGDGPDGLSAEGHG